MTRVLVSQLPYLLLKYLGYVTLFFLSGLVASSFCMFPPSSEKETAAADFRGCLSFSPRGGAESGGSARGKHTGGTHSAESTMSASLYTWTTDYSVNTSAQFILRNSIDNDKRRLSNICKFRRRKDDNHKVQGLPKENVPLSDNKKLDDRF